MRTFIRIVAGALRGRKVSCTVTEALRPTPQMVREAYFSILGNAIPDRLFIDIFAGTGVVGMEAISRGATMAFFIERDPQCAKDIEAHLRSFALIKQSRIYRTDAYRWVAAWIPPKEPVNVFLSPPFLDLTDRTDELIGAIQQLQAKVPEDSVIVVQTELGSPLDDVELMRNWERRTYGRNELLIWQREISSVASPT
ncbi:MAG: RsmD family RNA methyltransferase [Planctomycetes bacterium]|jgi:16S rRNA (guanine(966)-N(2))-methyltransferase RsmD|nr:RsmD family RNA methyltransferase [Planctomycetota bacterium]